MAKEKFDIIQSTCIPIQIDNCNTDLIIPARYLASTTRDPKFFGDAFMHDLRFDAEGNPVADFVMNQPEYAEAPRKGVHEIIVGGQNWGSGSSREHAAWAIAGYGVRVVLAMVCVWLFPVLLLISTATTCSTALCCPSSLARSSNRNFLTASQLTLRQK